MRIELKKVLFPQPKSKIKAGDGKVEGEYKFFTSSPIQSKFIDEANYDKPALIFGTGGNASVHYCDEPFSTSTDCLVMYGRSQIELETIYNYLKSNIGILENGFKGAGLKHISKEFILAIEIELPSEEIQLEFLQKNRIIDGLIEAKQAQLHLSEELVKSRFIEMFGDCKESRKLEEYAVLITKGASPKWQGFDYCDEGVLFVTSENVREGFLDLSKRKYLPQGINDILPRSVLKKNDILINIVNASIGRAAIYDSDELANINQAVALVRLKPNVLNLSFLLTYLNSDEACASYDFMKVGGDKANLSLKNISDLKIPVASMERQLEFESFKKQVDKSKYIEKISVRVLTIFWQKVYIWK